MANNKIVFGNEVLIDLTGDSVDSASLLKGKTAHDKSGAIITGECEFDANTQDADVVAGDILLNRTAYARGNKIEGSMPNNGGITGTISTKEQEYSVPMGYHDGSGKISIDATEQAKIIPGNIKNGVEVLGVTGTLSPAEDVTSQTKTVTPYTTAQTILPDEGYDYLSQVTVNAITYTEADNAAGGKTVTIGQVAPA